ncbi:carboxypeptidase-like regulatory domain-containing protein [Blastopirellula sp. JC732]|uniref:Carboxypeptidase-like regulatory domain-containing protein n=1 Tax=Blastopirellula sediminis TaxID=2894196 RepID=A0A9X1MKY8_9BACT|nr:carboxypeptidase-like regulatory domain-containing protein [Blastopirellula sediminis]MCC9609391.1 carboxypeptidase-like regulatory domain-containing protein [Blastopirellula sediminis]MCC9627832.1 carboxypeptidase-like regulatory domain-containing protein [Blastopirellula sediminis]
MINAAAVCLFMIGCGAGNQNPPTTPVTGKVTYKGAAVEGAAVKFLPSNSEAKIANATSGADGTYAISTFEPGDGAMAGKYKITVRKLVSVQQGVQQDGEHAGEPDYVNKDMLPKKYMSVDDTPLEFEVNAGGDNAFDIELKD